MKTIKIAVRKTKTKFINAVRKTKSIWTMYISGEINQPCGRVDIVLACNAGDQGSNPCPGEAFTFCGVRAGSVKTFSAYHTSLICI